MVCFVIVFRNLAGSVPSLLGKQRADYAFKLCPSVAGYTGGLYVSPYQNSEAVLEKTNFLKFFYS